MLRLLLSRLLLDPGQKCLVLFERLKGVKHIRLFAQETVDLGGGVLGLSATHFRSTLLNDYMCNSPIKDLEAHRQPSELFQAEALPSAHEGYS